MPRIHNLLLSLATLCLASCSGGGLPDVQTFDLGEIAQRSGLQLTPSQQFAGESLSIPSRIGGAGVEIWHAGDAADWTRGSYLVLEILDHASWSGTINLEFYKDQEHFQSEQVVLQGGEISGTTEDTPWLSCLFGVLPELPTQVVFPLSYLDAQQIFLPRSPRQLKGTISGNRLDPADISRVVLRFGPDQEGYYDTPFELASIRILSEPPTPYPALQSPIIDSLGQAIGREYPGKVHSVEELIRQNDQLLAQKHTFPQEWGRYGGWRLKKFQATGFFRTQHDGKRWWLVDPEGYAFLSTGVDCLRSTSAGPVTGIEDLFEWLPAEDDSIYADAFGIHRRGMKQMDFYVANLIRAYGPEWHDRWTEVTADLMRKFRVNTVANWSDLDFAHASQIPYVLNLNDFPSTEVSLYRDFPDVFSDEYQQAAVRFAAQLEPFRDDPYLVGYFLRNEPQWAFGYHNLAYEMFATDQPSATKERFLSWLQERYPTLQAFCEAWQLSLNDYQELLAMTFHEYPSDRARQDFHDFSLLMVSRYVDVPCDEVQRVDPHHLNLGMRYAWLSSDLLYKAGERFDVFSINGYGLNPPPTEEIARRSGKPVMIGEFHHGAVDRALPATGIVGVMSQQERAEAYRNYIEQGFARPELVGMHYFQWVDQPYYGRFDGENYNIGIVSQCNVPYPELTEAMTLTNERIYQVATGSVAPFELNFTPTTYIHY